MSRFDELEYEYDHAGPADSTEFASYYIPRFLKLAKAVEDFRVHNYRLHPEEYVLKKIAMFEALDQIEGKP